MRTNTIHNVCGISFSDVECDITTNGDRYFSRRMTISYADFSGNVHSEEFTLFSDDGYALVSKDDESQKLLKAA